MSSKYFTVSPLPLWDEMSTLVTQPRPTLCDSVDCRQPGSSVHGIALQADSLWDEIIRWKMGRYLNKDVDYKSCALVPNSWV